MKPTATAVGIVGMHRSGTSVLSRLASLIGVYLGDPDALVEPDEYNAEGYWEHKDIVQNGRISTIVRSLPIRSPGNWPIWANASTSGSVCRSPF